MTIKQLVEELTDQRINESESNWKMLQHSFYVKVLRGATSKRPAVIIVTNTPF
mgnify:FL=1